MQLLTGTLLVGEVTGVPTLKIYEVVLQNSKIFNARIFGGIYTNLNISCLSSGFDFT